MLQNPRWTSAEWRATDPTQNLPCPHDNEKKIVFYFYIESIRGSRILPHCQNESSCETIHMNVSLSAPVLFSSKSNSFSYGRFGTSTRFETEAQGNNRNVYMYNVLTNPSMKMTGHITLETPWVSVSVFPGLGSTLGKIVGMRQTKRPPTTARPQSSFRSVGLFRTMRILWRKQQQKD